MAVILLRAIVSGFGHKIGNELAKVIVNGIDAVRSKKALSEDEEADEVTSELPDDAAASTSPDGDASCTESAA